MKNILWLSVLMAGTALLTTGCDTTKAKSRQLARVAKDWSLVVRASQVIPVYPLTEDLQPGDIFLVQTREENQVEIYEEKGFLPLDQLIARLQPTNYQHFYLDSYAIGTNVNTPYHWKFPADTNDSMSAAAPRAAFPTYNFSVKRGGGVNLALPVQGVPVALNLLGSASAIGSITLADSYTFGVDSDSLLDQVQAWAQTASLQRYAAEDHTNYLRVVNRVYLTGRVNISMQDDSAFGSAASGGASKPVSILNLTTNDAVANYTNILSALNSTVDASLPGGTLKFAAATSRSVTMVETFERPLVIGYLAFDLEINPDGSLGSPVSTHAKLSQAEINTPKAVSFAEDNNSELIQAWLDKDTANAASLKAWLNTQGFGGNSLTSIISGTNFTQLRASIVQQFNLK